MVSGNAFRVVAYGALGLALLIGLFARKKAMPRMFMLGVFWIYMIEAIRLTVFPIPIDGIIASAVGHQDVFREIGFDAIADMTFDQTMGNLLLGFPFGFGAWFVIRNPRTAKILWLGLLWFLFIELAQLVISYVVGFSYRVTEVADIILNMTGVLIGVGSFKGLSLLPQSIFVEPDVQGSSVWRHVAEVLRANKAGMHGDQLEIV